MFDQTALQEGSRRHNDLPTIPPPVGGLNSINTLASMPMTDASVCTNWMPYPDRLEMRPGCVDHVTGFAKPVKSLHAWAGPTAEKLFAVTDDGVFDATTAGAVGATVKALTEGYTVGSILSTGAVHVLTLVNGVDSAVQYNGAAWSTVAAFAPVNTNELIAVETYKQRLFFIRKDTLDLVYLPVNSTTGAGTTYSLGAIFRQGGYLQALATLSVDGGSGPDDNLVVVSSRGEVAVFSGTDPSSAATWTLKGVYYIGKPLGRKCLVKYGGDVVFLSETGIYPISKVLLSASIDRTRSLSEKIRQIFATYVASYRANEGWEAVAHPDVPMLLVNIPGVAGGVQLVMHSQTGAWATVTGWDANCWARMEENLYYGTDTAVVQGWTGYNDNGTNITATLLQAYTKLGNNRQKFITMARPMFTTNSVFQVTMGFAQDFYNSPTGNLVNYSNFGSSIWGTSLWGAGIWGSSYQIVRDWRTVPDRPSTYKALYLQVASNQARVALQNTDLLVSQQGTF